MKRYCGSVCFDSSGEVVAVSAPRGNRVTFWDLDTGEFISAAPVTDGSGVAPAGRPGRFVASSGWGGAFLVDARSRSGAPSLIDSDFLDSGRWDNHLVAATPEP